MMKKNKPTHTDERNSSKSMLKGSSADEFYKILKTNKKYSSWPEKAKCYLSNPNGRDLFYQPLEVLVAICMSRMGLGYSWKATSVQGDGGVDLEAQIDGYYFYDPELQVRTTVLAQVKQQSRMQTSDLTEVIDKIIRNRDVNLISLLYIVIGGDGVNIDGVKNIIINKKVSKELYGRIQILDINQVLDLVICDANFGDELLSFLPSGSLSAKNRKIIDKYQKERYSKREALEVGSFFLEQYISNVNDGSVCEYSTIATSSLPRFNSFEIQFEELENCDFNSPVSLAVTGRRASEFYFRIGSSQKIRLLTRFYSTNRFRRVVMNKQFLPLKLNNETPVQRIHAVLSLPLLAHSRIGDSNREVRKAIESEFLSALQNKNVSSSLVLGATGVGKSHLCSCVIENAILHGFRVIVDDFDELCSSNNEIVKRLAINFAFHYGAPCSSKKMSDAIICAIPDLYLGFGVSVEKNILKPFHSILKQKDKILPISIDIIVSAFLIQILCLVRLGPVFIYLKDLHKVEGYFFEIITKLTNCLHQVTLPNGIFFLLEGIDLEGVSDSNGMLCEPLEWFRFIEVNHFRCHRLHSWNMDQSRSFLEQLESNKLNRTENLPLQRDWIDYAVTYAGGNPFFLLEHLYWQINRGILFLSDENYLFQIGQNCQEQEIPQPIYEALKRKVFLLQKRIPDSIPFLILCAQFGSLVPGGVFAEMLDSLPMSWKIFETIVASDIGLFINEESPRDFCFTNKYHVLFFRTLFAKNYGPPIDIAIRWYCEKGRGSDASRDQLRFLRILMLDPIRQEERIVGLIKNGLQAAEKNSDQRAINHFLKIALKIGDNVLLKYGFDILRLYHLLVISEIRMANMMQAKMFLDRLESICVHSERLENADLFLIQAKAIRADICLSLMKFDDGLIAVNEGLVLVGCVHDHRFMRSKAELLHRQAVLLWFAGEARKAFSIQMKAFRLCKKSHAILEEIVCRREIGTNLLHFKPKIGIKILQNAVTKLEQTGVLANNEELLILKTQKLMGELCVSDGKDASLKEIRSKGHNLYLKCKRNFDRYNAIRAALICGAVEALLRSMEEAKKWFALAIADATAGGFLEDLWMARLNIATVCCKNDEKWECEMHAEEAMNGLTQSVKTISSTLGISRKRLIAMPLFQLKKILGDNVFFQKIGKYPSLFGVEECDSDKVTPIFVKDKNDECFYFMMS